MCGKESPKVQTPTNFSTKEWERNRYLPACSRKVRSQSPKSDLDLFCLYSGMSWSTSVQEGGPGKHSWSTADLWYQEQALLVCRIFPIFKPFLSIWASLCKFSVGFETEHPVLVTFGLMLLFADWMDFPLESMTPYRKRIQILAWNFLIVTVAHKKKIKFWFVALIWDGAYIQF